MLDQLTAEVRAFLNEPRFAVIATIGKDCLPQQTVLWYELEQDTILLNTKAGRVKDHNLARDPRLSFCVEDGYRYVTITGTVELNDEQEQAVNDIVRLAVRYDGQEQGESSRARFSKEHRITMRLHIERLSAYGFDR